MSGPGAIAFTDIVGFTAFTASEGDDRALEVLDAKRRIVDELLPDGARVVKELGDGLLLWLGRADEGARFCVDLQRAAREASTDGAFPVWLRIGLHWGEALERGDDLIGHDVNIASRIVDQASPGETLASDALVAACRAEVRAQATPIGPVLLKGLPDAVWLHRFS